MTNRRAPLQSVDKAQAEAKLKHGARIGGVGLDFDCVPDVLDAAGRAEWERLAGVYRDSPTRFREGDRAALCSYCLYWSAFLAAAADVATNGPVVPGRSAKDEHRLVKNPASVMMRECSVQVRLWARELGLTPDARGRMGIADEPARDDPVTGPARLLG